MWHEGSLPAGIEANGRSDRKRIHGISIVAIDNPLAAFVELFKFCQLCQPEAHDVVKTVIESESITS